MKKSLLFLCFGLLIACQEPTAPAIDATAAPQQIKNQSPQARFEAFVSKFPTVELPYTLSAIDDFPRMEDDFTKHFLEAQHSAEYGLNKEAFCLATFKVYNNLAVIYKWASRPAAEDATYFIELAVFTPYGAKKQSLILGQAQAANEQYKAGLNFSIDNNFTITTAHQETFYIGNRAYESFYKQSYQITQGGSIQAVKKAAAWERIPKDFTGTLVENYKRNPEQTTTTITDSPQQIQLTNQEAHFHQTTIYPVVATNGDELFAISSIEMEPIASDAATADAKFYVKSTLSFILLELNKLDIRTQEFIDQTTLPSIYEGIKTSCNCPPSPEANDNGILYLTALETAMDHGVSAFIQERNIQFKCLKNISGESNTIPNLVLPF